MTNCAICACAQSLTKTYDLADGRDLAMTFAHEKGRQRNHSTAYRLYLQERRLRNAPAVAQRAPTAAALSANKKKSLAAAHARALMALVISSEVLNV